MAKKKTDDVSFQRLKEDLKNGSLGRCYILHGEEDYLRDYYLEQMVKSLVDESFRAFNYVFLEGEKLDIRELEEAIDSVPMMAERKVVVVRDLDLYAGGEEKRKKLAEILSTLPDYICLILVYQTVPYKQDNRVKEPTRAIRDHAQVVEFQRRQGSEMFSWVRRRFKSLGHDIDTATTEHLMFLCGGLMTNLISEIGKIAAYAKNEMITRADIDAVATPVLEAVAFDLTGDIAAGDFDKGLRTLRDLFLQRVEPIMILGAVGSQVRSMYLTRLARDKGLRLEEITRLLGYNSDYPTRRLLSAVEKHSAAWCRRCVLLCADADAELKSSYTDGEAILETLLVRLSDNREAV